MLHVTKQVYPCKVKVVQEAFIDTTSYPFDYLLLDFKQGTSDKLRFRTKVFPDDTTVEYVPFWRRWRRGWVVTRRHSNVFPGEAK